jgi:hypothetical protein
MQIHEITKKSLREGVWGDLKGNLKAIGSAVGSKSARTNIGRGFVQGLTGTRVPPTIDAAALASASASAPATERIVVAVSQPGQSVPANYYKVKDTWTNELGDAITEPRQIAYLDKLIPTHGKKEAIVPPPVARKISRRRTTR